MLLCSKSLSWGGNGGGGTRDFSSSFLQDEFQKIQKEKKNLTKQMVLSWMTHHSPPQQVKERPIR